MKSNIPSSQFLNSRVVVAITVLLVILLLDIFLPLDVYVDTMFIFCMFLISKEPRKTIVLFSLQDLVSVLVVFALETKEYTRLSQYINKGISFVTVMAAAALAMKYSTLQAEKAKALEQRIQSLEKIIFMNSHHIRIPVTNIMGLSALLENTVNSQEELAFIAGGMKDSVTALDDFTKEPAAYAHTLRETP